MGALAKMDTEEVLVWIWGIGVQENSIRTHQKQRREYIQGKGGGGGSGGRRLTPIFFDALSSVRTAVLHDTQKVVAIVIKGIHNL